MKTSYIALGSVLLLAACANQQHTQTHPPLPVTAGETTNTMEKSQDSKTLIFTVGPELVDCVGVGPMKCMIVNDTLFYDQIKGFTFKPGITSVIEVTQEQFCDPKIPNSCPMDVSIYKYTLNRLIKEN